MHACMQFVRASVTFSVLLVVAMDGKNQMLVIDFQLYVPLLTNPVNGRRPAGRWQDRL